MVPFSPQRAILDILNILCVPSFPSPLIPPSAHPTAMHELAMFCACGAVGQLFIFLSIRSFGSLTNTTITTTRKFFNILLSVIWNGTVLLPSQWLGASLVLGGLLGMAVYKDRMKKGAAGAAAAAKKKYEPEAAAVNGRGAWEGGREGAEGAVTRRRVAGRAPAT